MATSPLNSRKRQDLSGKRISHLTVLGHGPNWSSKPEWLCKCDCGKECVRATVMLNQTIRRGARASCGCLGKTNSINLAGLQHGWITVISRCEQPNNAGQYKWNCVCSCGETLKAYGGQLPKSCGCRTEESRDAARKSTAAKATRCRKGHDYPEDRVLGDRCRECSRDRMLRKNYNISLETYEKTLEGQNGRCGICCNRPGKGKNFNVDHCHRSGIVRGLLCRRCNQGLGLLRDNYKTLKAAERYLAKAYKIDDREAHDE